MKDNFDRANRRARFSALKSLKDGIPAINVAEALIVQGLVVWAAETGRQAEAQIMLAAFTMVRDS